MTLSKINTNSIADDAVTTAKVNPTQTDITSVGTLTSFASTGIDDNADATSITIDSSENVGIKTTTPTNYYADDFVVTAPDEGGMTIVSGTAERTYLAFADGTSGDARYRGFVNYDHNTDTLGLGSAGGTAVEVNTNKYVNIANQPSISVDGNTNSIITDSGSSSYTITEWTTNQDSVFYSQGITYDNSNGRFTVPVAGKYLINVSIYLYQNGVFQRVQIYVNGSNTLHFTLDNTTGDGDFGQDNSLSGSTIFNLSANDYISFHMYKTGSMANSRYYFGPKHSSASIHLLS